MLLRIRQVNDLPNIKPSLADRRPHGSENTHHPAVTVQRRHMRTQVAALNPFESAHLLDKEVCGFAVLAFTVAVKAREANTSAQWPGLGFDLSLFFGGKSLVSSLDGGRH